MTAPLPTKLDPQQVLQHAFDDNTGSLRTTVTATITPTGSLSIAVTATEDSISLGSSDGSLTATYTQVGLDTGLDTYVINPLAISSLPAISVTGTSAVSGAVSAFITNPISITGTTAVSGSALTATIAGTSNVNVTNPISVSAIPAVSATITSPVDYGTSTAAIRTAAQIGNATGAADFNTGNASAQTLRTVIATNQPAVTIKPTNGTFTDFSANASTTSTVFVPANPNRKYLLIFNNSGSTNIWINFGAAANSSGFGSFRLGGNSLFIMEGTWINTESINIISGSGSPPVTVKEGT